MYPLYYFYLISLINEKIDFYLKYDIDKNIINLPTIKMCINQHFMPPYFVHDNSGDYYAPKSVCKNECDGKFIYFCTKCKNVAES